MRNHVNTRSVDVWVVFIVKLRTIANSSFNLCTKLLTEAIAAALGARPFDNHLCYSLFSLTNPENDFLTSAICCSVGPFQRDRGPSPAAVCPVPALTNVSGAAPFGNGTAASCTQAALQALLNAGGPIVCNCGPAPYTLVLASTLQVSNRRVVLDGLNRLTLSGGGTVRALGKAAASAADGTLLALQNLTFRDGFASDNGTTDRLGGAAIRGRAHGKLQVLNVRFVGNAGPVL